MVNPMIVEGQTIDGVAQGIGTALYEESPYDANGQPLASTMMDYVMPGATEVPPPSRLAWIGPTRSRDERTTAKARAQGGVAVAALMRRQAARTTARTSARKTGGRR